MTSKILGGETHQRILEETILALEADGYRVIDLEGKSPDAIVIDWEARKVKALEVLGTRHRKGKGWHKNWSERGKRAIYHMFDEVIIKVFYNGKRQY